MKKIFAGISILALIAVAFPLGAATEVGVNATVTVQNIAVSVSDGTVAYGTLTLNSQEDTTSSGVNNTQVATNDGNVVENFNIKGADAGNWTLAGAAGANQYVHEFCRGDTGTCDATAVFTALTTSYQELDTNVATSGTQDFDLQITTPTSSDFVEHTAVVTVQATI